MGSDASVLIIHFLIFVFLNLKVSFNLLHAKQTDRASSSKASSANDVLLVKLTEVEEDVPEEKIPEEPTANISSGSSLRPSSIPARIHKDSLREVSELEPIDEQSERLESTSLEEEK